MYKIACEYDKSAQYVKDYNTTMDYPEYPWKQMGNQANNNAIYNMVRNCLIDLELDKENFGTAEWNPFSEYIMPGNTVVIKPNLVMHKNYRRGHEHDVECVYTNPCVVAPIIDYIVIGGQGDGSFVLDPMTSNRCSLSVI